MPSSLKNTVLLALGRTVVALRSRTGDPGARLFHKPALEDPYPHYESVRAKGTLVPSKLGLLLTADHAITSDVLRDPRWGVLAPSEMALVDETAHAPDGRVLVNPLERSFLLRDPPDHTRLRRYVGGWFTPRALRRQMPAIEAVVERHLDIAEEKGTFDLVDDFAKRVPVQVIADLLGVPASDHDSFIRWGSALVNSIDGVRNTAELELLQDTLAEFDAFLMDLVERRRREPGTDIVSDLVAHDDLALEDLIATTELLLVAGFETTVNLIGTAANTVMGHPEVRGRLIAEHDYAERVVEEALRWDPPVQYVVRVPLEPLELAGRRLAKGTPVLMLLAGANRDPGVFADPHRFDPDRADVREHLAFSSGIHYCLGANLARMEATAAVRALFRRFPELRAAGPVSRRSSPTIRGALHLPVNTGVTKRSLAVDKR
ncbi:cytochrome P450 [Umezawaea sp. Da 62-37]|uniref:cytochrome P450 n=1 Tax=Umezawaea sp. Da 62-37 TaxID=3075927 RepID=UPI0028F74231|nr:cytochrome P450 [Umezawaea sp. Da 62-37]WNV88783.1 cytochrome P450 [Umezawaea sp. Da 62-37]